MIYYEKITIKANLMACRLCFEPGRCYLSVEVSFTVLLSSVLVTCFVWVTDRALSSCSINSSFCLLVSAKGRTMPLRLEI